MSGHVFVVRRRLVEEMLADSAWAERLRKASSFREVKRVVMDFCVDRGYRVHHELPSGRLVVCS